MKLVSYITGGKASYGAVEGDRVADLGAILGAASPTLRSAISAGVFDGGKTDLLAKAARRKLSEVTLLPPVPDPDKIICIGLNYRAHAVEAGLKVPEFPALFLRLTNTLVPESGALVLPKVSAQFDFEGELAFVVGKGGRHIKKASAFDHIFGYSCFNDASIRDFQFNHSLTVGKNFPATGAFGPWLVTADEIPNPAGLTLTTRLNGREVQKGSTDDLIFDLPTIVEYVSTFTELTAGDVITTGTPHGVGLGRKPPLWMKAGDVIEVEISKIGTLRNKVIAEA
jgi:2-keto-4-pentenoate hydratase/2-oxohepta-3-ene-1,7-dioic acid hydratase in catechol pathway